MSDPSGGSGDGDHHRTQILYEISLAISPGETLEATAESALGAYLQKLN